MKNTRKIAVEYVAVAAAAGILFASACSSTLFRDDSGEPPLGSDAGFALDADTDAAPVAAEFGLDHRPPNTTCLAPTRPATAGAVKLERVFAGVNLQLTIAMAQPPGDKTRWFVASRNGKVVSFPTASPPAEPTEVADVATLAGRPVETAVEGGFLGFAFHPQFATNGRLYITFTTTDAGGPASEVGYLASTNGGASFSTYTKVFSFNRNAFEHCGGGIAFDKEGHLLLGFGDDINDTNGQRPLGFSSRILRLDVDHPADGKPYGIPTGNPYKNGGVEPPEVFAKGVRNPYRISVDRATGEIWTGDVGQDTYEEINRIEAGGNYGWPCREGAHDYKADNTHLCPSTIGLTDPVIEYAHAGASRSVTGGIVYRGAAMPAFHGTYVYGDFISTELWTATFDGNGAATVNPINVGGPSIAYTNFSEDDDGEIYASTILSNEIYKLVPAGPVAPSTFPERLSKTGCVDPANPMKPAPGVLSYGVNAPLWSDGAAKERALAIPDGKTIGVAADGDLDLPIGSVLIKSFSLAGKRVETRLFVRHEDGEWAGYSYEWNDAQTDAFLLHSPKTRTVGTQAWSFPSRTDCMRCHTAAAGRSLGLELGQLNGEHVYPSTNRRSNQLKTLEHIGMFAAPLGRPVDQLTVFPDPAAPGPLEARARAYLHSNCSMCHRPKGGPERAPMDFRFATSFADMKSCGVESIIGDLGVSGARILTPGKPETSLISLRVHATDKNRMPPLASSVVDGAGAKLLDDWIRAATCP